jgi:hypothetical protein
VKKRFTKMIAGISSAAILTSFSALAVPAFAAEYEAVEADAYVNSLEDEEVREVAQYLIDNGISLEETQSMVARYENGLAMIQSEEETAIAKSVDTKVSFYKGTRLAQTQHYGVLIIDNSNVDVACVLQVEWYPEPNDKLLIDYDFVNMPGRLLNGFTGRFKKYIYQTEEETEEEEKPFLRFSSTVDASGEAKPLGMADFPITILSSSETEASIRNACSLNVISSVPLSGDNTTYQFHTYALGDYNHDGIVNDIDYTYLMQFVTFSFDGKFEYKDMNTEVAYQVNRLAADTNRDGKIDLNDAVTLNGWGYCTEK